MDSTSSKFVVIYDDDCGFCQRSLRVLRALDLFGRFTYLGFHQTAEIQNRFPALNGADFENAMYAVDPQGRSFRGFFAFRRLLWASPLLWIFIPLFYFPTASFFGPRIYAWIAKHRTHLACKLD